MISSVQEFRDITRDVTSYDDTIWDALVAAQKYIEQKTGRFFELRDDDGELIHRTETLKMYRDGRVYPKATPVYELYTPIRARMAGPGVVGTTASRAVAWWGWSGGWEYTTGTVEYSGGYEPDEMPVEIVQAVVELAASYLETTKSSEFPVGATSVHVGDVSLTLDTAIVTSAVPSNVYNTILTWKRREI